MKVCGCGRHVDPTLRLPCKTCRAVYHATNYRRIPRPVMACPCCGQVTRMTVDHVRPLATGGDNAMELTWLCRPCNSSKGTGTHCRIDHGGTP